MKGTVLHLLTRIDAAAVATVEADRDAGFEVHCVLLHDAVYALGTEGAPRCDRVSAGADDRRRRGLHPTDSGLEYAAIVAAMADAVRVVSW